jgi:hypothetical protein
LDEIMTQTEIRDLLHHQPFRPFRPFRLHLADGKNLSVPPPDFTLVAADYVAVARELPSGLPGRVNLVSYEEILRVEALPRKRR